MSNGTRSVTGTSASYASYLLDEDVSVEPAVVRAAIDTLAVGAEATELLVEAQGNDPSVLRRAATIHDILHRVVGREANAEELPVLDELLRKLELEDGLTPEEAAAELERLVADGHAQTWAMVDGLFRDFLGRPEGHWDGGYWHANAIRMLAEGKSVGEIEQLIRETMRTQPEYRLSHPEEWLVDVYLSEFPEGVDPGLVEALRDPARRSEALARAPELAALVEGGLPKLEALRQQLEARQAQLVQELAPTRPSDWAKLHQQANLEAAGALDAFEADLRSQIQASPAFKARFPGGRIDKDGQVIAQPNGYSCSAGSLANALISLGLASPDEAFARAWEAVGSNVSSEVGLMWGSSQYIADHGAQLQGLDGRLGARPIDTSTAAIAQAISERPGTGVIANVTMYSNGKPCDGHFIFISGADRAPDGHWVFTIKDSAAGTIYTMDDFELAGFLKGNAAAVWRQ